MLKIQMEIRRSVARLPAYLFDPLVVYGERGLIKISRYRDKAGIGSLIQVFRLAYSYRWGLPGSYSCSCPYFPQVHNLRSELSEKIGEISATPMINPTLLRHVRGSDYRKRM